MTNRHVRLSYSDDAVDSFSNGRLRLLGVVGQRIVSCEWWRLGSAKLERYYKIDTTAPVVVDLIDASVWEP